MMFYRTLSNNYWHLYIRTTLQIQKVIWCYANAHDYFIFPILAEPAIEVLKKGGQQQKSLEDQE